MAFENPNCFSNFRLNMSSGFGGSKLFVLLCLLFITAIVLWRHNNTFAYIPVTKFLLESVPNRNIKLSKSLNCGYHNYIFGQPVDQADPCLIAAFKEKYLISPSPPPPEDQRNENATLNITDGIPTNIEKLKWVEKILIQNPEPGQRVQQGFYIECGANDGEFISPTILLEKLYNWTGLLIEANPLPFKSLMKRNRNAYAVNAAVCITPHPERVTLYSHPSDTGYTGLNKRTHLGVSINSTVQCIPLYTMLAALEVNTVDYLSLDVEGLELAILETVPFDKIRFKVMTIEHWSIPRGYKALKDFLEPMGYRFVKTMKDAVTMDSLFVHKSLYKRALSIKIS